MGYTTDFEGKIDINKPLAKHHIEYLQAFAETRRMKRNATLTDTYPDPTRLAADLPVGDDGGYFVGNKENCGQTMSADVVDYNSPPKNQPGLWCQWIPNEDGTAIQWDGGEKFYDYIEWLEYLIKHFLEPWGYILNGKIHWSGEEVTDHGTIFVENNKVRH